MTSTSRWTRVRLIACAVVFGVLFAAVARRAFTLQVLQADRLRTMAEEQYLREIELPPRRGRILDRNGAELASTADVDSIYCNPRRFVDPRDAARKLAGVLGMDRRDLEKRLTQRRFFAWVKRKVTPDEVAAVKALNLPGVAFTREPRRFYPNRSLAATVMGHSGSDGRGLEGIELAFDRHLRGTSSSVQGIRDALGRDLFVEGMAEAPNGAGADVVLTIDRYLTFVTERAIAEAAERHHAKGVTAVMMDPTTGDVLAMAAWPTYNPNEPSTAAEAQARNRAITDTFEPGSTMKTFTIAAALEAGAVKPEDRFDCMMGRMMVGKYQIHDTHGYGLLTVTDIFKHSSNIGTTKVARRLGRDRFAEALARFGFGRPTQVGLPGERGGIIRPVARWGDIGFANMSFGQGLTVTALQMTAGVSAIAAGGVYRAPRVVARIVGRDGTVTVPEVPPERQVMSPEAARTMAAIMRGVTEQGGTAKAAAIEGYTVGGKTGTAQKVAGGRYDPDKWVSSFVGFAPVDDPRIVLIVVVDEPQGVRLGGVVAAPVFKEIAEQALRYLHVPPSPGAVASKGKDRAGTGAPARRAPEPDESAAAEGNAVPPVTLVDGTTPSADDDSDEGAAWDEVAGSEGGAGAEGLAATVTIPDFTGMSIAEAIRAAHRSGIELAFDELGGAPPTGVAVRQRPAPGTAPRGAVCRVAFGRPGLAAAAGSGH